LRAAEEELSAVREDLRLTKERRDTLTSTNVTKRLAAVEAALTAEPLDIKQANDALRAAVSRIVLRPQEGLLDLHWHHATEPQQEVFITSRHDDLRPGGGALG
jgi:phage terminase Nu1 subunit (DNA packaging protein)